MESDTRIFVSAHSNIIFTHADKGNVTVALDKDTYLNKMITLLSDVDTYILKKDPTKELTTALRFMFTRWKTNNYISATLSTERYIVVMDHFRESMDCRRFINLIVL